MAEITVPIKGFRGLDDRLITPADGSLTSSLSNVVVRHGRITGRLGTGLYLTVDDGHGADEVINGLLEYRRPDLTNVIVRVGQTVVERLNSGGTAWDVITGTALTGGATDLVQSTVMDDILAFTNNGKDLPRRYNGSGNTAAFADTSIPNAKSIASGLGFMFLGNISDDGTFTDLTNGSLTIRYSDDPFASDGWATCDGNEIVLDGTPGEIRAMRFLGRTLLVYKSDAVVALTFVGGAVRFAQQFLPFDKGIIAPLSLASVGAKGHVFLATDQELYATNGSQVEALPPNVINVLQNDLAVADAEVCVAATNPDDETYNLFYPRTAGVVPNGRVTWNYRTGEWYTSSYTAHNFSNVLGTRRLNTTANVLLGTDPQDDNVYHIDTGQHDTVGASTDTVVDRFYDTDWQDFGVIGDKYLTGVSCQFRALAATRVEISVARDYEDVFRFPQMYDLAGQRFANASAKTSTRIRYEITPTYGEVFNIRFRFFHDGSTNVAELHAVYAHIIPHKQTFDAPAKSYSPATSTTTSTETSS